MSVQAKFAKISSAIEVISISCVIFSYCEPSFSVVRPVYVGVRIFVCGGATHHLVSCFLYIIYSYDMSCTVVLGWYWWLLFLLI